MKSISTVRTNRQLFSSEFFKEKKYCTLSVSIVKSVHAKGEEHVDNWGEEYIPTPMIVSKEMMSSMEEKSHKIQYQ